MDDLTQEVFLRFYNNRHKVEAAKIKSYLMITVKIATDSYKNIIEEKRILWEEGNSGCFRWGCGV